MIVVRAPSVCTGFFVGLLVIACISWAAQVVAQSPPSDPQVVHGDRWRQLPEEERHKLMERYHSERQLFELDHVIRSRGGTARDASDPAVNTETTRAARLLSEHGWEQVGPEGGDVEDITVDPNDPQVWYAASRGGFYKSGDGGVTWHEMPVPLQGTPDLYSADIVVHPLNSNRLYASSRDRIYRSDDGGATWSGYYNYSGNAWVNAYALAVDPSDLDGVYVGGYFYSYGDYHLAVARSEDGGATWSTRSLFHSNSWGQIHDLVVDPNSDGRIYASGSHDRDGSTRVIGFRSDDHGDLWTPIYESAPGMHSYPQDLAVDRAAGTIYLAGSFDNWTHGLLRSTDQGASWTDAMPGNGSLDAVDVAGSVTYSVGYRTLYASLDGGHTWESRGSITPASSSYGHVEAIATDPTDASVLVAATDDHGLRRSLDGGDSWVASSSGFFGVHGYDLAVDPTDPQTLYLAAGIAYKSNDGGASWTRLNRAYGQSVELDPADPATVYFHSWGDFYRSSDAGATWTHERIWDDVPESLGYAWRQSLAVDPTSGRLYIGAYSYSSERAAIVTSGNGGADWELWTLSARDWINTTLAPGDGRVYVAGNDGDDNDSKTSPVVYSVDTDGSNDEIRTVIDEDVSWGYVYSLAASSSGTVYAGGASCCSTNSLLSGC